MSDELFYCLLTAICGALLVGAQYIPTYFYSLPQ